MKYHNLDQNPAYHTLLHTPSDADLNTLLDLRRVEEYSCAMGEEMHFNYAATPVTPHLLKVLQQLAREAQVLEQYQAVLDGAVMNGSEQRMVLHHLTRGQCGAAVKHEGEDLREFYSGEQERYANFAREIHAGKIRSSAGHDFTHLCQIGIGGSDLGPRALYLALEQEARRDNELKMGAEFISNVDPDDAAAVLARLDLSRTLFILVSKSGTTQETLTNAALVR
ncbi:MAG: glucose-6-phosphate isomerase, partial [Thermodesulfobacteriota bacterium]